MTVKEARKLLTGAKLKFGDPDQIEARKLVDLVEELKGLQVDCDECDGRGKHECTCGHEHDCAVCDGTGDAEGGNLEWMGMPQLLRLLERAKEEGVLAPEPSEGGA